MENSGISQQKRLDPQDIGQVALVKTEVDVNAYLAQGWLIVGMSSEQYSEHGFSLTYHLGWSRELGEPSEVPLTGWRKLIAESKERENSDGSIPF